MRKTRYTVDYHLDKNDNPVITDNDSAYAPENCNKFYIGQKVKLDETYHSDDIDTNIVFTIHSFTMGDSDEKITPNERNEDFDEVFCILIDEEGDYVADVHLDELVIVNCRETANWINNTTNDTVNTSDNYKYLLIK